jgi:death on curing protein
MDEPRWVSVTVTRAIHADQIREHGGRAGLRDRGMLESALERPRNRFRYQADADLHSLAAAYGYGIAKNHPFVDGNKRVAFLAMYVFLALNGFVLEASEEDVVELVLGVASGATSEENLATWLRSHTQQAG